MKLPDNNKLVSNILSQCNISSPPVPLSRALELYKELEVAEDNIKGEGYIVDLGNLGGQIILNESTKDERKRYTLAHELGHWVLHTYGLSISNDTKNGPDANIERWCNQFAAKLLMPEDWILSSISSINLNNLISAILTLPSKFRVSKQAIFIRIPEISPISIINLSQEALKKIKVNRVYYSRYHKRIAVSKVIQKREKFLLSKRMKNIVKLSDDLVLISQIIHKDSQRCRWIMAIVSADIFT